MIRRRLMKREDERGSILVMVLVVVLAAFVSMLALADSGQKLTTLSNAYDIAGQSARLAAGYIEPASLQAGAPVIDEARAVAGATAFASAAGAEDISVNVAADGLSVIVSLSLTGPDPITPGFDMKAEVRHQAFMLADPN